MRLLLVWLVVAGSVVIGGLALDTVGLPSSYLFTALIVGLIVALVRPDAVVVPDAGFRAGQAVAGVVLGAYLDVGALHALADSWLPVLLVSAGTLAVAVIAGAVLARVTTLDPPTAAIGLIPGGASGIVGISGELGADDRQVAFMQYLRVLIVVTLTPIGLAVMFPGHHTGTVIEAGSLLGSPGTWIVTLVLAAAGALLARRVTAGVLIGPMVLTGVIVLGFGVHLQVPELLAQLAFAAIGLQVGLRFTKDTVHSLGPLLMPVLASILALLVLCFGFAVVLDATTSASLLDAYLATTPGGLYAVLAVAAGSDANTTFILAVQTLRVFAMVLVAPGVVRWTLARTARS